jgi:GNAT superfamily N-acetyltransferase
MTPFTPYGETGESHWDVYLRAGRAIQQLLRYPPGRYLVVAHGAILNMAMYIVLGIIPQAHRSGARFALQNTAFAALTYHPVDHTWRLLAFNDHFHWPEGKALQDDKTPLSSEQIPPISANSWTIRLATLGDIEGIAQIFLEVDELHIQNLPHVYQRPNGLQTIREDYLTDMLASPDNRLLIAEMGGEPIGAVLAILREAAPSPLYVPRRFVVVDTLCVRRAFQRLGVGRALMEAVHVWGKEKGACAVELTVWEFNAGALAFYQKLGYRTANRRMWIDL